MEGNSNDMELEEVFVDKEIYESIKSLLRAQEEFSEEERFNRLLTMTTHESGCIKIVFEKTGADNNLTINTHASVIFALAKLLSLGDEDFSDETAHTHGRPGGCPSL